MKIKAVIFDFGRVISAQKPMSLFREYEEQLGIEPHTINRIMFGSPAWEDALLGRKTSDEFWRTIASQLNLNTPQEVAAFRERYRADEAINEATVDLIRRLDAQDYLLAVLSNSPPGLARWLEAWGLLDPFDTVFCSGDEGVKKPDPAAFHIVLDRLKVLPQEAVFIDDTPGHVATARSLGIHGIHFTTAEALEKELMPLLQS